MSGVQVNRSAIDLPTDVSAEIIQKTLEASPIMKLAKRIPMPGRGLTIPIIATDPVAEWVDETGVKPVSNPTLDKKIMQPYKLAVIETFSMEFRRDMKRLYDALIARIPFALSKKFDLTVLGAENVPGSNFDTLANATAQDITTTSAGSAAYDGLVAADIDIALHGGNLNGFALSPQARGVLLSAKDQNGRPLFINSVADGAIPLILGHPTYMSNGIYQDGSAASGDDPAVPDVVGIAGDWTKAMYGTVEGVKIDISDQATLTSGNAVINLWQQNMFAVRAEVEIGFRADDTCFNLLTRTHAS